MTQSISPLRQRTIDDMRMRKLPHRLSDPKPPIGAITREALQPPAAALVPQRQGATIGTLTESLGRVAQKAWRKAAEMERASILADFSG